MIERGGNRKYQHTLRKQTEIKVKTCLWGFLETRNKDGEETVIKILPAEENRGIVFQRSDMGGKEVEASLGNASVSRFKWINLRQNGIVVSIVEHLLAALYISGVDNAIVVSEGRIFPSLLYSIRPYLNAVKETGLVAQKSKKAVWRICRKDDAYLPKDISHHMEVRPGKRLEVDYTIDFKNQIGRQNHCFDTDFVRCYNQISMSRAFNSSFYDFLPEFILRKYMDNFIVVKRGKILNERLRYENEPVRHKAIDFIGDVPGLLGGEVEGKFTIHKGGHLLDLFALKKFLMEGTLVREN